MDGIKDMSDMVNHPPYYKGKNGMEAIDVIEAFNLNFNLGCAVKYLLRCGKKLDALEDLRKSIWYIQREIKNLEAAEQKQKDAACPYGCEEC